MARYFLTASARSGHASQNGVGAAAAEFSVTDANGDAVTGLTQADVDLRLSYDNNGASFVPGSLRVQEKSVSLGGADGFYLANFGGSIDSEQHWPANTSGVFVEIVVANGADRGQIVTSFNLPA